MKFTLVLLISMITWFNLARWFPAILTNIFVVGPLLLGTLLVIVGAGWLTLNNNHSPKEARHGKTGYKN